MVNIPPIYGDGSRMVYEVYDCLTHMNGDLMVT